MRNAPRDVVVFRLCLLSVLAAAASLLIAVAVALRLGAADHAIGVLLALCTAFLQATAGVMALVVLSLPAVLLAGAAGRALWLATQGRAMARVLLDHRVGVDSALHRLAAAAGIAGRVDVVDAGAPHVFVYGLRRPRMLVTTAALELLDEAELAAVVEHEAHHVHRFDPLRLVVAHAAAASLFLFPVVRDLARKLAVATELEADRRAMDRGLRIPLASALTKFLSAPGALAAPGVSPGGGDGELRLAQLIDPDAFAYRPAPSMKSALATMCGVGAIALMVQVLALLPAMNMG